MRIVVVLFSVIGVLVPGAVRAQGRVEVGGHIAVVQSGEFESTDKGLGARIGWRVWRGLGIEAEVTRYPGEFPDGRGFSQGRWEALVGATFGITIDRVRPFGRVRPGWLVVEDAGGPVVCIAIFPPPLSCTLAAGRTLYALDLGGGLDVTITPRTFFRVDVGDRILRYPHTVLTRNGAVFDESFLSHDVRVAAGGGLRF